MEQASGLDGALGLPAGAGAGERTVGRIRRERLLLPGAASQAVCAAVAAQAAAGLLQAGPRREAAAEAVAEAVAALPAGGQAMVEHARVSTARPCRRDGGKAGRQAVDDKGGREEKRHGQKRERGRERARAREIE